ncbi:hypothetical protein Tco_1253551 [Tanacetum coccineum]
MQIAQPVMNMDQDRQMLMVENNAGNQFRLNSGQIAGIQNGYNVVQNVRNHVVLNAVQNTGVQNVENQNGNGNIDQKEEAGIQLNSKEFDFMAAACAYDEIEEVNANCTLKDNSQKASTSGTQTDSAPVYDSDGSTKGLEYGRYGVSKVLDTAYQGFFGVGTTHRYAISSLLDTAYWLSEQ